jgi:hypothetical protein
MYVDAPADDSFYREMAITFIEEYMMMGWSDEAIFKIFEDPFYGSTYDIFRKKGGYFIRALIGEVRHG